jgi:hypothetical protein
MPFLKMPPTMPPLTITQGCFPMPVEAKPLFRPDVLRPHLQAFKLPANLEAARETFSRWATLLSSRNADKLKEKELLVPLFPELVDILSEGFRQAEDGATFVITRYRESTQNLRSTFAKIRKRAGLKPWPKPFQNLRSTRETELAEVFPLQAVTSWIGNSQLGPQSTICN